jgi:hypothetical protein
MVCALYRRFNEPHPDTLLYTPGKCWGARSIEGLMNPTLTHCCINHEKRENWNSTIWVNKLHWGFFSYNWCQLLCLSLRLSVFFKVWKQFVNGNLQPFYSLVCSQWFIQIILRRLSGHSQMKIYLLVPLHQSLFSHQFLLYLLKLLKPIWSSIPLHKDFIFWTKNVLICRHSSLSTVIDFVIICDAIYKIV